MRAIKSSFIVLAILMGSLTLSGCGSSADLPQLDRQLEEIKKRPRGRIEPPPEFKAVPTFAYGAHQKRSPFSPPTEQEILEVRDGEQVEPDTLRTKEYLERFPLDSLRMVGTIARPGEGLQALIADPSGTVTRVRPGSYMGNNYGRVAQVTATKVALIEIVPDGRDGWVERASNVSISE